MTTPNRARSERAGLLGAALAIVLALAVSQCAHAGSKPGTAARRAAAQAQIDAAQSALFRLCRDMPGGARRKECENNYAAFIDKRYPPRPSAPVRRPGRA